MKQVRTHDDLTKIVIAVATLPPLGWCIAHPKNATHQVFYLFLVWCAVGFIIYKYLSTSSPTPQQPDTFEARRERAKKRGFFDALMGR
jgi:hypothetical protein